MQWRVLTACFLLIAICAGGLAARYQAERLCREIALPLAALCQQLEEDREGDAALLARAQESWRRGMPFLSGLTHHERLEAVSERLAQAEGFLAGGDRRECAAQIRGILYLLEAISAYDAITFQTIF